MFNLPSARRKDNLKLTNFKVLFMLYACTTTTTLGSCCIVIVIYMLIDILSCFSCELFVGRIAPKFNPNPF